VTRLDRRYQAPAVDAVAEVRDWPPPLDLASLEAMTEQVFWQAPVYEHQAAPTVLRQLPRSMMMMMMASSLAYVSRRNTSSRPALDWPARPFQPRWRRNGSRLHYPLKMGMGSARMVPRCAVVHSHISSSAFTTRSLSIPTSPSSLTITAYCFAGQ
jgi:hypothetical protein